MTSRTPAALLALAVAACTSRQARPDLLRGAPLAATPVPPVTLVAPAPEGDLMLVNPLACLMDSSTAYSSFAFIAGMLCVPVLAVVDVVAMPVLAAVSGGKTTEITPLTSSCTFPDPAPHAADLVVDGLVSGHGMVRVAQAGPGTPVPGSFRLEVATERFVLSGAVSWSSRARLVDASGDVVWDGRCEADTSQMTGTASLEGCEAARAEVAALGDSCARRWLGELAGRRAGPGEPTSASEGS